METNYMKLNGGLEGLHVKVRIGIRRCLLCCLMDRQCQRNKCIKSRERKRLERNKIEFMKRKWKYLYSNYLRRRACRCFSFSA